MIRDFSKQTRLFLTISNILGSDYDASLNLESALHPMLLLILG